MIEPIADRNRRIAGLCGLAGALLFFVGDMLFYGHLGSGANFSAGLLNTVTHASDARLFAGGLVGPLAACLCIIGFWHVYLNTRSCHHLLARLTLVSFSILMVAGSAIHVLWTAHGLAIKYCSGQAGACAELSSSITAYWSLAYDIGSIPGYVAAVLLFALVLLGKSNYPRWTALANPAVLTLLSPVAAFVPSPVGAILVGGSTNLSIATFFLVSVVATWNGQHQAAAQSQLRD